MSNPICISSALHAVVASVAIQLEVDRIAPDYTIT